MTPNHPSKFNRKLSAKICAVASVLISLIVVIGWVADILVLKTLLPNFPAMQPNTAIAFAVGGFGLFAAVSDAHGRLIKVFSAACGFTVFLIGSITLAQYIFGFDAGIDRFWLSASDIARAGRFPGRMAPLASLNFTFVGLSLALLGANRSRLRPASEIFAVLAIVMSFGALLGHLYGAKELYGITEYIGMALHTAGLFILLGLGILTANSDSRTMKVLLSDSLGGVSARRLLPVVILVPSLLGWLRILGQESGLYDTGFGAALSIFSSVVLMFAIIFFYSEKVHSVDLLRKAAEKELADNELIYRNLFDHSLGLICTHDLDGILQTVNPATLASLGFEKNEMVGRSLREFVPEENLGQFAVYLRQVAHDGIAQGLISIVSKTGKTFVWRYHNILVSEPEKEPFVLSHAQDVTQLLAAQEALKNVSLTDELTGLYNRRGFLTFAEQQLRLEHHKGTARGLVLMFADMDGLKEINDRHGHQAGSEAIVAISEILKSVLRGADLIARWGGDEFVILTIGSREENSEIIIGRIQQRLRQHNSRSDTPYELACSIGVAPVRADGEKTIESIIAEADQAMYAQKRRRKQSFASADEQASEKSI